MTWFLFAWDTSATAVVAGTLFAAFIAMVSFDVFIEEHEAARHSVMPRVVPAMAFLVTLVISMYAASFRTLGSIIGGRIEPRVVHFRSRLHSDLARVTLAESITFTPGTITLELDEDHFIVHWLNATTRHSAQAGEAVKGRLEEAIKRVWL
jgi:multicomponent Na+:H+ antiporter subunit E